MLPSDLNRKNWVAIRNCSTYWFARLILGYNSLAAKAFVTGVLPLEQLAINRVSKQRTYARLRATGLPYYKVMAIRNGTTVAQFRAAQRGRKIRRRERWGGIPAPGTAAFNRWVVTK